MMSMILALEVIMVVFFATCIYQDLKALRVVEELVNHIFQSLSDYHGT